MSQSRDDIVEWTNGYLRLHDYHDYGPMGLQFTGTENVEKIVSAVSISADIIREAAHWGANMIFTHHGLWWNNESRSLDKRTANRIELAQKHNISILGYHLCLDAHPEIGNNMLLAKQLGLSNLVPFGEIGWGGELLSGEATRLPPFKHRFLYGSRIKRIAVIAGGAPQYLTQAYKEGYDTFITGEAAEYTRYQAEELGMNFIAAGHHDTEKSGIMMLGSSLVEKFGIEHRFIDAYNPV